MESKILRGCTKYFSIIIILPSILNAQNIVFTASCDRTQVAMGETFALEVKVGGDIANPPSPKLPPLPDFDVLSTGRMESISIVNTKVSSEISFTYTLLPHKEGNFTIGPCTMEYKGKTYKTNPIEIEVVKSSAPQGQIPKPQQQLLPSQQRKEDKALFATLTANKSTAYVNEEIILSFKFYQGVRLLSSPQYAPPSFTGFWIEELGQAQKYETVNGRQYLVTEIKYALFPTTAGSYTLGPATVNCQVEDFFGDPFSFSFGGGRREVQSNQVKIKVLNLPDQGKPQNFSGAVGELNSSAILDNHTVHQDEPVTLRITVTGQGNIKSIEQPKVSELPEFKVYQSGADTKLNTQGKITGQKTFNVILVPKREGRFEIPAITFTYFNPQEKEYKIIATSPLSLTVLGGTKGGDVAEKIALPTSEQVGKDIRYIKTEPKLITKAEYFYKSPFFLFIQLIPILALIASIRIAKQKERLLKDKVYTRTVKADRLRRKMLAECKKLMAKGEYRQFYDTVYKTLTEYIGGKLNIPAPALTLDIAIKELKEKGVKEECINKLRELFYTCEQTRFGKGEVFPKAAYENLVDLIVELSKRL